ncbi:MAG: alanyl-tRNA editing protein [Candidatus Diapherotrites archaeon]|nr:alanyl-tRNA editing protein [Candidatus Diapherotrites archaeon]
MTRKLPTNNNSLQFKLIMTEKLYLKDSYLKEFSAKVEQVLEGKFVILDRTAFYAQGGGQPSDTGKLVTADGKEFKVLFVKQFDENVSHEVENASELQPGIEVKGFVDWEIRYTLMKMHTALHLLSEVIRKETGALTTGNQIDLDETKMDFNIENYTPELVKNFEEKTNQQIARNLEVKITFMSKEEALKNPKFFKLKDVPIKDREEFRIVSIGDFDEQADGGTQVNNTSEIGRIQITKTKNKGTNNKRIYFKLEP